MSAVTSLDQVDLFDPEVFIKGVPFDMFAVLRREAPVYRHPQPSGENYWAVTRYQDVLQVSRDVGTFSSARLGAILQDGPPADLETMQMIMLNMDPPRHTKLRSLVNKGFTPNRINKLMDRVGELCTEIVDNVAAKGECDFVTDIAAELPLHVIAEMVGIPVYDRHKIFAWSNKLIGFDDPEFNNSPEVAQEVSMQMYMYANELALERKDSPQDDLVSVLMRAEVDGEQLSEMEFDLFFLLLAVAGNETTRNLISGGMQALFDHPDQFELLKSDPSLTDSAVEEMLRWVTPVMQFQRTAQHDTELGGQKIAEGDRVVIYYASANRDETVFENPDVFDIRRSPNEHLTFGGGGTHFCLGANLARLEIQLIFKEILQRLPDIEPNGEPRRLRSNFINGVKEMPVRFTAEAAKA